MGEYIQTFGRYIVYEFNVLFRTKFKNLQSKAGLKENSLPGLRSKYKVNFRPPA
jgi:hypothetical protein